MAWRLPCLCQDYVMHKWLTNFEINIYKCLLPIRNWRTLLHMRLADASRVLTRWQHFSAWNVIAAILKVWRRIRNRPTYYPVNRCVYLYEEQSCQLFSRSMSKHWVFWRGRPTRRRTTTTMTTMTTTITTTMSNDMRPVPDQITRAMATKPHKSHIMLREVGLCA